MPGGVQAQEDAQLLKSVVLPLEEEIKTLKEQLRQARLKLQVGSVCWTDSAVG